MQEILLLSRSHIQSQFCMNGFCNHLPSFFQTIVVILVGILAYLPIILIILHQFLSILVSSVPIHSDPVVSRSLFDPVKSLLSVPLFWSIENLFRRSLARLSRLRLSQAPFRESALGGVLALGTSLRLRLCLAPFLNLWRASQGRVLPLFRDSVFVQNYFWESLQAESHSGWHNCWPPYFLWGNSDATVIYSLIFWKLLKQRMKVWPNLQCHYHFYDLTPVTHLLVCSPHAVSFLLSSFNYTTEEILLQPVNGSALPSLDLIPLFDNEITAAFFLGMTPLCSPYFRSSLTAPTVLRSFVLAISVLLTSVPEKP